MKATGTVVKREVDSSLQRPVGNGLAAGRLCVPVVWLYKARLCSRRVWTRLRAKPVRAISPAHVHRRCLRSGRRVVSTHAAEPAAPPSPWHRQRTRPPHQHQHQHQHQHHYPYHPPTSTAPLRGTPWTRRRAPTRPARRHMPTHKPRRPLPTRPAAPLTSWPSSTPVCCGRAMPASPTATSPRPGPRRPRVTKASSP